MKEISRGKRAGIEKNEKERKKRILIIAATLILLVLIAFVGRAMVRFVESPANLETDIEDRGIAGLFVFCLLVIVQTMSAFIPGGPFMMAAGYVLGAWQGALLYDAAACCGTLLAFMLAARFSDEVFEAFFPKKKHDEIEWLKKLRDSDAFCFLIFLLPAAPKDLMTYLVGSTGRNKWRWTGMAFGARFPVIFLSTYSGASLGQKDYLMFAVMMAVTAAAYGSGTIIYRKMKKKKTGKEND